MRSKPVRGACRDAFVSERRRPSLAPIWWEGGDGKIKWVFKNTNDNEGFTLIEILVIIAIIAVLAAIAIPQLTIYRARAYNKAAVSDLKNASIAQEAYYMENRQYCNSLAVLSGSPYNFHLSGNVTLTIVSADQTRYNMVAYHPSGDVTYTLSGPGGSVVP